MECLIGNYGLGTQDGRDYSLDWEIVQHPDNCEDNIDGDNLGYIVEEKVVPNSSCYFLNDYDSAFNIWNVSIFTYDIDPGYPRNVLVDRLFQWGKSSSAWIVVM